MMQISQPTCFALALLGLAALAPSAKAQTTLSGLSDFTGVTPVHVNYSATAPESNFSSGPVSSDDTVAYDVYLKGDANNVYGLLTTDPAAGDNSANTADFANVYLSTNPADGTNVGFEVTNYNAFVPGGKSGYDLHGTGFTTLDTTGTNGSRTIEFAIPWNFFTTDPLNMGFEKIQPGGTFQIRDSQSFGYTYVGGNGFGPTRLGQITYDDISPAPEPSQIAGLSFSALGALGLVLKARKRSQAV